MPGLTEVIAVRVLKEAPESEEREPGEDREREGGGREEEPKEPVEAVAAISEARPA